MISYIDSLLNRFTMYRVVLYSLILLLVISFVFALTGQLSISAGGLVINIAVLSLAGYTTNLVLKTVLKVATNNESWLITALILACILPTSTQLSKILAVALTSVIAIVLKFLITWHHSPIFNPAAIAAVVMSISGLLAATWWIGSPPMAAFCAILGFLILRKQRKFSMFFAFALLAAIMVLYASQAMGGQANLTDIKTLILSSPLIFLGTIMLTEPTTLPSSRYYQVLYGIIVGGILSSELHAGRHLSSTPEIALVIGNIFAVLITKKFAGNLKLKQQNKLADNIYELAFTMPDNLSFLPGQYLEWTLPHKRPDSRGNRRSFSIASSPSEKDIRLAFKHYDDCSTFKKELIGLSPGQTIKASRPTGDFILPSNPNIPLIFIAGGIGITPFRSMIKYLIDIKQTRNVRLIYVANKNEFAYQNIFKDAEAVGVKTNYASNRLDEKQIKEILASASSPLIYISGPDALVRYYKMLLFKSGASEFQIKTDYFSGY
jgi:ferredoxin-NADP reductase/Na+-translocating ferredoxin:NAD+ oxidoreductase RnfD subunit